MAKIPENKWKDILRAKSIAREKFCDEDGQWFLKVWAKKNNVFRPGQLSDYEQGIRSAILELMIYSGMDEVKMIEKIKEITNEE